ncbi:hypothetical protein [Microtetraspora sp. NBRC 13810]|uniref:hypothetical protein n=1 Tax=Microtetraspora sp. NBRC 13810 TaxID=3030990 RepID=UPI0025577D9E|nr:hypothetical protein [Microtetraspora sp. NBRC 13810]
MHAVSDPKTRRMALSGLLGVAGAVLLTGGAPPAPIGAGLSAAMRVPAAPAPPAMPGGTVVRGERSEVIGPPGADRGRLAGIAAVADRAARTVAGVWGPTRAVIEVPADTAQAARLAGTTALEGLAAVALADRVVIVPDGFARLSPAGRAVVLTHELTHVATGAALGTGLPIWLTEGFADYVGYRDSGIPVRTAAAELADEVRAGRLPRELPSRDDFRPGGPRVPQAYEEAWLACRYIAGRYGERALVALYRRALRDGLPGALAALGLTTASLTAHWRAHLAAELR